MNVNVRISRGGAAEKFLPTGLENRRPAIDGPDHEKGKDKEKEKERPKPSGNKNESSEQTD